MYFSLQNRKKRTTYCFWDFSYLLRRLIQLFWETCNLICINLGNAKGMKMLLSYGFRFHMDQFGFQNYLVVLLSTWLHVNYHSIILLWRLLHSRFKFRVLFSVDNLHAECCSATLSVWMSKFIVLQHFRRGKILCMLDKHGPLNEMFWFLLFTKSDYSYVSFLCALETTNPTNIFSHKFRFCTISI